MNTWIILLNYNNYQDTIDCFNSIEEAETQLPRILIVDNASNDGSIDRLEKEIAGKAIFLRNQKNGGFSYGINKGLKFLLENPELQADSVLILNNDTVVAKNFLSALQAEANRHGECMLTGKAFEFERPEVLHMCGGEINFLKCTYDRYGAGETDSQKYSTVYQVGMISCYFMFAHLSIFRKVGLLNEDYFIGTEETEFNHHCNNLHIPKYYVPESVIWHKVGGTFEHGNIRQLYNSLLNKFIFMKGVSLHRYVLWYTLSLIYYIFVTGPRFSYRNGTFFKTYKYIIKGFIKGPSLKKIDPLEILGIH